MIRNPFIGAPRNPILERSHARWRIHGPTTESRANLAQDGLHTNLPPQHHAGLFFKFICTLSLTFLIATAFVFREIQHYQEQYRLGRQIAAAEAQTRRWQERERLEEARKAALQAELHRQQFATGNFQLIKTSYVLSNRGQSTLRGQR